MFPLEEVQSPEKGVWKKTALLPLVVKIGLCRQEVWLESWFLHPPAGCP